MLKGLAAVLLGLPLAGCMTAAAVQQAMLDNVGPEDFVWSQKPGTGVLTGSALTDERLRPGAVCTEAELRPTGFGVSLGKGGRGIHVLDAPSREDIRPLFRRAACDAEGCFRFEGLPPGPYEVVAVVPTEAVHEGRRGAATLFHAVTVGASETQVELRRVCRPLISHPLPVVRGGLALDVVKACDVAPARTPEGLTQPVGKTQKAMVEAFLARGGLQGVYDRSY